MKRDHEGTGTNVWRWAVFLIAVATVLVVLLSLLTAAVSDGRVPSQDRTVFDAVAGWDVPGVAGLSRALSTVTGTYLTVVLVAVGVVALWLTGRRSTALAFVLMGGSIMLVSLVGDSILGGIVGRARPLDPESTSSYPSGHTFSSTVLFGFAIMVVVHRRVPRRVLIPIVTTLGATILAVGFSRMFEQAHWPSDVAGGYLLGALWLVVLIPAYLWLYRVRWLRGISEAPSSSGPSEPHAAGE